MGSAFLRSIIKLSREVLGFSDIGIIGLNEKPRSDYELVSKYSELYEHLKTTVISKHDWAKTIIVLIWPYTPYKVHFPYGLGVYSAHYKQYPLGRNSAQLLSSFIEKTGFRSACDSGIPVKAAAFCAGLGKYGRNSLIYTKEYGSWITIHTLVTDAVFSYDNDFSEIITDCEECTLCMDVCPTKAIMHDGELNKGRCLREYMLPKGFVPLEMRKLMGSCILGCDICQIVCPNNKGRYAKAVLPPDDEVKAFDIKNILCDGNNMDNILDYIANIVGTNYAKKESILSAAAIIAGNLKDIKFVPYLKKLLNHPNPPARAHAAWAFAETDGQSAKDILANAITKETDEYVKLEMENILLCANASRNHSESDKPGN